MIFDGYRQQLLQTREADPLNRQTINVELESRSYPIEVVEGGNASFEALTDFIKANLERTWAGKGCQKALVVTDSNVREHWAEPVRQSLETLSLTAQVFEVPAGEQSKSLETLSTVYDHLMDLKADRHTLIVAVGGGVVGDLAGFAAASFNRGLPLIMFPTTLLSQVDSSVGGKTGVNHPRGKNLIGAFHQPIGVWIDLSTLNTLPDREFRSGLAEVVKYGVIQDPEFFAYLEAHSEAALQRVPAVLGHIVSRSCRLKADVVQQDEFEQTGLRAILNFGHTVAHAIENVSGYGEFLHGEAVAIGMVAEAMLAEELGWLAPEITHRLVALLSRLQLPVRLKSNHFDALFTAMKHDKKNRSGRVRFILPKSLGKMQLTDEPTPAQIQAVLETIADKS